MIEIIGNPKNMASNSAKALEIEGIVKAWAKIERDEDLTEEQKSIVSRTAMFTIWKIYESENEP